MAYSDSTLLRVAAALATLAVANAHGFIVSWTLDDQTRPGFDPSYDPKDEQDPTAQRHYFEPERGFPVLTSKDTACGAKSTENTDVPIQTWDVTAGTNVVALWDQWPIAHKGPILQYLAACPESGCDGVDAATLPWFKISEDAYDGKEWASDKLNSSGAAWTFKIPEETAPGPYLIRHELIAMHFAGDPQVYPVCVQANVKSSGTFVATDTVTFPEAYFEQSLSNQFETFNVNESDKIEFVNPGPAVVDFSKSGAAAPAASGATSSPVGDAPSASSNGGGVAAPSASGSGNSGSGSTDAPSQDAEPINAPTSQVEEAPAQSDAAPISTANSAAGSSVNEQPSATAVNGGQSSAAPIGSGRGGRGRYSRRPREARSCMASASATAE